MALSSTTDWSRDVRSPLVVIAQARDNLRQAERLVADFITENPALIVGSTVSEVARGAGTSDATVVRLCRSLGLKGFPELKLALARDVTRGRTGVVSEPALASSDSVEHVGFVAFTAQQRSLADTVEIQKATSLEAAVETISEANYVLAIGDVTRSSVLTEAERRFSAIGVNISSSIDVGNVAGALSRLHMGDAVLSFPGSSISEHHSRLLEVAVDRGATSILVTPSIDTSLDHVNIALHVSSASFDIAGAALESVVSEVSMLEVLLVAVAMRRHSETLVALKMLERARTAL